MQRFTSRAVWKCPLCDHTNAQDIEVPELNFLAERNSDMSTDGWAEIKCDQCSTGFTGNVYVDPAQTSFEINDPENFSFSGDSPMYEPEEDYVPPDDPYAIIVEALDQLHNMIGVNGPENDLQFINRLVFAGSISSLEAYLGDTLINSVHEDQTIRNNLLKNNDELGQISVTAAELAEDPEIIAKRITAALRAYLYHNLQKVDKLYKAAFEINITPSKAERDVLYKAMILRHDCVHRNGRNPNGEKSQVFTSDYVREVVNTILDVVNHIEFKVHKYNDESIPF